MSRATLDIARALVRVDVACNDPRNGVFTGRAEQIQIGSDLIDLEAKRHPAPAFAEVDGTIRLAGMAWPICGWDGWVGNWCWNGYWLKIDDAVRFLTWLHQRDLYTLSTGETRIFNRWRVSAPFGESDEHLLWRLLGKPSMREVAG